MSAFFASASSQAIVNSAPAITAVPFTVGCWVRPTTTGAVKYAWSLAASGAATVLWGLRQNAANTWSATAQNGGVGNQATIGTVTANAWYFILCRMPDLTNMWIHVLDSAGSLLANQNTAGIAALAVDRLSLGSRHDSVPGEYLDGSVAEWWITNSDVANDSATSMSVATMRQLASKGPFSLPRLAGNIVDYRSLRYALGSDQDSTTDYYDSRGLRQVWTNTNAVTLSAHTPFLVPEYQRPGDIIRTGIV